MKRYEKLAEELSGYIRAGILRPGDRLPSVRSVCRNHRLSPATVLRALRLLEDRGEIHARPRSGHYVSAQLKGVTQAPNISRPSEESTSVDVRELVFELLDSVKDRSVIHFGSAFPSPELFPLAKLARALGAAARRLDPRDIYEHFPPGNAELRRQIARRYLEVGCSVPVDEIVITTGALEGLNLCLQAVAKAGDLVAIESPAFCAALEAIERLGLKAVEIPTHPGEGVNISALATALDRHTIKVCWLMTNFQNPLGALMPEEKKRELVKLLSERDVPLIENDVYSELYFSSERPKPAKAFDTTGLVMHCGSFSKCLAPGYRVGWAAPGKYAKSVERGKIFTTIATSAPMQSAIVEFLKEPGYNHHLRKLRQLLADQQGKMLQAITHHFPSTIRMTRPQGGYFVWVELPQTVKALEVHRLAMEKKIGIAPGPIFSPQRKFENCIRINYGLSWTPRIEAAIATLGGIIASLT
jgi:DNA-binding transcriptional MocR family regulator